MRTGKEIELTSLSRKETESDPRKKLSGLKCSRCNFSRLSATHSPIRGTSPTSNIFHSAHRKTSHCRPAEITPPALSTLSPRQFAVFTRLLIYYFIYTITHTCNCNNKQQLSRDSYEYEATVLRSRRTEARDGPRCSRKETALTLDRDRLENKYVPLFERSFP